MKTKLYKLKVFLKIVFRKYYQSFYLVAFQKKINSYKNKVDLVKNEFEKFYVDIGPEHGILQGFEYEGANTHCTQCLYTLTRLTKSKNVLEIGSYRYRTTNQIAKAIEETHGLNSNGNVVTFDVIKGGYDAGTGYEISSPIINANFWYPYKSGDTEKLDNTKFVFDNSQYSNKELVKLNKNILKEICLDLNILYFDLVFIDGDHTAEGIQNDFEVISEFANRDTLIVIDNIWDSRLIEVKKFFDQQNYIKWNFKEFNDKYFTKNKVQDTGVLILEKA
jgi:predicted O-methyltransferase YrrM